MDLINNVKDVAHHLLRKKNLCQNGFELVPASILFRTLCVFLV